MTQGAPRKKLPKLQRPWWRAPFRLLLRARLRRRHVHGTFIHRILGERLFAPQLWLPNAESASLGMALGTFVGFMPLPGLQMFFAVLLCYFFRANVAIAVLGTFLTNPFTTPAIIWAQYRLGRWLLPAMQYVDNGEYRLADRSFAAVKPFLVGSVVSSVVLGLLAYPLTLGTWKIAAAVIQRRKHRRAQELAAHGGHGGHKAHGGPKAKA